VTCRQRETLPIAGFALKENRFDGLYIGRQKGNELIYAGKSIMASTTRRPKICRRG
jgi:bifunctional non-homologous end joining protein LigD